MIYTQDSLEFLKEREDFEFDINYCDPPYALGSEIIIRDDGKVDYKKAVDFMSKWDMLTGDYWEKWFKEAYRTLKYGGTLIMFGMDRQLLLFKYYAQMAGFVEQQSMYWYYICNDENTEILTRDGFKKHYDIKNTDEVLTLNTDTDKSEWQPIKNIYKYDVIDEELVRIKNRDIDQLITKNHRVLCKQRSNNRYNWSNWKYIKAKRLLDKKSVLIKFPLSFVNKDGLENDINYFALLGWIFTDGWYQQSDNSVRISQSSNNQYKVNNIIDILGALNTKYKNYERNRIHNNNKYIENVFYINNDLSKDIKDKFPKKEPTYDLLSTSYSCRYALFETMMAGDGSVKNSSGNIYDDLKQNKVNGCFYNKSRGTSEFFQALATSLGFKTYLNIRKGIYEVYVSKKDTTEIQVNNNNIYLENYNGTVWSIETENTNYCIRRNGKVSFTGNSGFPKATDLSKMIDKNLGVERTKGAKKRNFNKYNTDNYNKDGNIEIAGRGSRDLVGYETKSNTDLGKKYEGYKYSIAPLKQCNETIMIFKKPYKTGSCMRDVLEMENGNTNITCGALNIDGNRVKTNDDLARENKIDMGMFKMGNNNNNTAQIMKERGLEYGGRYPAQTFINNETAEVLDKQSGISKSSKPKLNSEINRVGLKEDAPAFNSNNSGIDVNKGQGMGNYGDTGGCSKILHKCNYEQEDHDLYFYNPKVSKSERNAGCDEFEEKTMNNTTTNSRTWNDRCATCGKKFIGSKETICHCPPELKITDKSVFKWKNYHPTLKPIDLNYKILKLYKTPNEQKIVYPFAGAGSEIIGGIKAGFNNWIACEINQEYVDIANARIEHWSKEFNEENKQLKMEI